MVCFCTSPMLASTYTYQHIYAAVSRIPRGRVATYGQIARLAEIPGQARLVGYALSALDERSPVPWHRVVNAAGEISRRSGSSLMEDLQRTRLQREGVVFDANGRIKLSVAQWRSSRLPEPAD